MPRFYFDTHDGDAMMVDDRGIDLADAKAAHRLARVALTELAQDSIPSDGDTHFVEVKVRDEKRVVIFEVDLKFQARQPERH